MTDTRFFIHAELKTAPGWGGQMKQMQLSEKQILKFRSDSGKRTYIITTRRIASDDELK